MQNYSDKISYWFFKDRIPVVKFLIVANAVTFLAIKIFNQQIVGAFLEFSPALMPAKPWTLFTYPLAGTYDPISMLFSLYWLWVAGGSLERSWGSAKFSSYFFIMSAISAASFYAASLIINIDLLTLSGLWLPLAGATIAFAMLNPEQQILFMFVLPLKLKYLALIDVILVFASYGMIHPLLGIFALAGCAYSYWYILPRNYSRRSARQRGQVIRVINKRSPLSWLNPWKAIKEKRERKKLKELFERSYRDENNNL